MPWAVCPGGSTPLPPGVNTSLPTTQVRPAILRAGYERLLTLVSGGMGG